VVIGVAGVRLPQSGTPLSISGPGITIRDTSFGTLTNGLPVVEIRIDVAPDAPLGARSLIIADVFGNRTIATGGLEVVDLIPLRIRNILPSGSGAALNSEIFILFSEKIDPLTANSSTISVVDVGTNTAVSGTVTLLPSGRVVEFTPASPLPAGGNFRVTITDSVTDLAGNRLDGDNDGKPGGNFTSLFDTIGGTTDATPPTVVSVTPPDGATNGSAIAPVVIKFSEPINPEFISRVSLIDPRGTSAIYTNDFQTSVGSGWSSTGGGTTISTTPAGRRFLGRDPTFGFDNETVSLTLGGLPTHTDVTVTFDLFIIQSWDGNGSHCCGPDIWNLSVGGGPTLLNTTFNIVGTDQAFPGMYPGASNPARTGAVENNTLGYGFYGDSVYHLSFTFPHSATPLILNFSGSNLQGISDESWGIDNVTIDLAGTPVGTTGTPLSTTFTLSADGTELTVIPTTPLPFGIPIRVEVQAMSDLAGNAMVSPFTSTFTTLTPSTFDQTNPPVAFSTREAMTVHTFTLPSPGFPVTSATLEVGVRGDFGASSEFASVMVGGRTIGTVGGFGSDCNSSFFTRTFTLPIADLLSAINDGKVTITLKNSSGVDSCTTNDHQVRLTFNFDSTDTDGDGMVDSYENFFGLKSNDPTDASRDDDGDGLTNLQESQILTDPKVADADHDGLNDREEIAAGTNPRVADTDGDGLIDSQEVNVFLTDPQKPNLPIQITPDDYEDSTFPAAVLDSKGNIHIVYVKNFAEPQGLQYLMLNPHGRILIAETNLTTTDARKPEISIDSQDDLHIAWHVYISSSNIETYYTKLNPYLHPRNGSPAIPSTITLIPPRVVSRADTTNSVAPSIKVRNDNVHLVWRDGRGPTGRTLHYLKMDANGTVLIPDTTILTYDTEGTNPGIDPEIDVDNQGNVHLVFVKVSPTVNNDEVFYMMVNGANGSAKIAPTMISNDDGQDSKRPSIAIDASNHAHTVWQETGVTDFADIRYIKINPSLDDQNGDAAVLSRITLVSPM
ncbi:MAG: Ig-like domain-containing protein, partial [Candidatus Tectomicrobia bacterium]|nr:Ig-like domain-containing protein [Candidatus Tectomicrobia bacterium]